jgi:hypothetical protein
MVIPPILLALPPMHHNISPVDSSDLANPKLVSGFFLTWADGHPDACGEGEALGILGMSTVRHLNTGLKASKSIVSEVSCRGVGGEGIK